VRAEQVAVVVSPDGSSTTATFTEESAVSAVEISDEVEGEVTVVEYEEEPDSVGKAPGQSVAVTQIAVPPEAEDTAGTVTSRISRATLDELGTEAENLRISRYSGNGWEILQTDVVRDSETELLVSADTPRGFSYFSVSVVSEPEAVITSDQTVAVGEQLTLDGSMSSDRYGDILSYDWEVAGTQLTGETVTTTLDSSGEQLIRLTVTNDAGETDTVTEPLTVGRAGFQLSTFEGPETVTVESEFEVSGTVTNTGAVSGSQTIVYSFGDERIERTVELASGESTQLSFTVTAPEQSGTYSGELTIAGNKTEADILVEKAADDQSSEQADDSSKDASDQASPEEESSDGFGPGFGLIPAVVALISVAVLFGLRYRNHH
jgi:PGF-pre-PGF domain-containing protein